MRVFTPSAGATTSLFCLIVGALLLAACERPADEEQIQEHAPENGDTLVADDDGPSLLETLREDNRFSTFATVIDSSGLADTFGGPGPLTVFAPINDAFDEMEEGSTEDLLRPENRGQLTDLLMNHVINGRRPLGMLHAEGTAETIYGDHLAVDDENGKPVIDDATIVGESISAGNGLIHPIDAVLFPADVEVEEETTDGAGPDTTASR